LPNASMWSYYKIAPQPKKERTTLSEQMWIMQSQYLKNVRNI